MRGIAIKKLSVITLGTNSVDSAALLGGSANQQAANSPVARSAIAGDSVFAPPYFAFLLALPEFALVKMECLTIAEETLGHELYPQ